MSRLARRSPPPRAGVVHLGLGAFFRAHGALYIEEAMARSGGDWGIVGVSLRSPDVRDRLQPQGGLYTAIEAGPGGRQARIATAVSEVLVAPEDPAAVLDALDRCRLVTLTITEKGYCHVPSTGRLDTRHPDIRHDIENPDRPVSAIGFLVGALDRRRRQERPPFPVVSCDNIPANGHLLKRLVLEAAALRDGELAAWIDGHVAFPATMVDRIVPATTDDDRADARRLTGRADAAPVVHEPFRQWVVEDSFGGAEMPDLAGVGVELVSDVAPYEAMKLRMLNGAHSAIAYLGYLAGHATVAEAAADPALASFLRHVWRDEIAPVTAAPPGVSLSDYAARLMDRFANPGIAHSTWQIAMDGSQKLPQRLLGSLSDGLRSGRPMPGLCLAVAAWMQFTSSRALDGTPIDVRDPLAGTLARCWQAEDVVGAYLAIGEVFPESLSGDLRFGTALRAALDDLRRNGARDACRGVLRKQDPA